MPRVKAPKTTGSISGETKAQDQTVQESKEQRLQRIQKEWQEELASRLRNKDASEGSQAAEVPEVWPENYQETEETQDLDDEDGPFYSLALPFPKKHHKTAELLALVHHYQARYEMTMPEFGDDIPEHGSVTGIIQAMEHNHECSNDLLIVKLIDWLGTGDYGSVLLMAEAFKGYELGLPDLDGERNRGKLCAMVACNDLQAGGRSRAQSDKTIVRKRADEFRAILDLKKQRPTKNGKKLRGFKWSAEAIRKRITENALSRSDWTHIYRDLGLEDLSGNPGAKKTSQGS